MNDQILPNRGTGQLVKDTSKDNFGRVHIDINNAQLCPVFILQVPRDDFSVLKLDPPEGWKAAYSPTTCLSSKDITHGNIDVRVCGGQGSRLRFSPVGLLEQCSL